VDTHRALRRGRSRRLIATFGWNGPADVPLHRRRAAAPQFLPASCAERADPLPVARAKHQPVSHDVAETADFPTWLPDIGGKVIAPSPPSPYGEHQPDDYIGHLCALASPSIGAPDMGRFLKYVRAATSRRRGAGSWRSLWRGAGIKLPSRGNVVGHLHALNKTRRKAEMATRLIQDLIGSTFALTATSASHVLLLARQAITDGTFTVAISRCS